MTNTRSPVRLVNRFRSGALAVATAVALSGCSSSDPAAPVVHTGVNETGSISGTLEAVGGPAPGSPRPLPGQVSATGGGHTYSVAVGQSGRYSITVPGGSYIVTGRSPLNESGTATCEARGSVRVQPPGDATADVLCQER